MVKVRAAGNRLSISSWNLPFWNDSQRKQPQNHIAVAAPAADGLNAVDRSDAEISNTSLQPRGKPHTLPNATKHSSNMAPATSLIDLAATITRETEKLERYLQQTGSEMPGFENDSPLNFPKLPDDVKKAREEIMRATKELGDLVTGPTESVRWMAWDASHATAVKRCCTDNYQHNNSMSLQAIYRYRIAKSFPADSTATFEEIASKVGLDEVNVRRFLRHAMTNRIFQEPSPGVVAHTAASRVLAEDEAMDSWVGLCVEDMWPAASLTLKAIELNPAASEPNQSGFCVSNNTFDKEHMFATFGKDPLRAKRMGKAMASLTGGEGYEISYMLDNYDWTPIDSTGGTFVDIGGSHGFVCVDLAHRYKNIKFVVQDLPKTVASAPQLDDSIADRITFQAHDFHTEQPVKGADIYYFRWILHNHSDKYALNMLKQLIPALKKGARVVINDHCLPEPGQESLWDEKIIRTMDLVMLTLLNARERTAGDFKDLFEKASSDFKFLGVKRPKGCRMSIIEAVWEGENAGGKE